MAGGSNSRNFGKSRYDTLERLHDLVAISEITEGPCLLLEKGSNGVDRSAVLELLCEWMFGQRDAGLLFIVVQCRLEKGFETR